MPRPSPSLHWLLPEAVEKLGVVDDDGLGRVGGELRLEDGDDDLGGQGGGGTPKFGKKLADNSGPGRSLLPPCALGPY